MELSTARAWVQPVRRWLIRAVAATALVAIAASVVVVVLLPRAVHGGALTVLSGSMSPELQVGSVVLVRPVDPRTLEVGDVATYQPGPDPDVLVTHRIVSIDERSGGRQFIFKGDANRGADSDPVIASQVKGEVWFDVPILGSVRDALHGEGGVKLVAMLLLAGYAVSQFGAGMRERQRSKSLAVPRIDRPLVYARFSTEHVDEMLSLDASELASRWSGTVVAETSSTFSVLIPAPGDRLPAVLELLTSFEPLDVAVITAESFEKACDSTTEEATRTRASAPQHDASATPGRHRKDRSRG